MRARLHRTPRGRVERSHTAPSRARKARPNDRWDSVRLVDHCDDSQRRDRYADRQQAPNGAHEIPVGSAPRESTYHSPSFPDIGIGSGSTMTSRSIQQNGPIAHRI